MISDKNFELLEVKFNTCFASFFLPPPPGRLTMLLGIHLWNYINKVFQGFMTRISVDIAVIDITDNNTDLTAAL